MNRARRSGSEVAPKRKRSFETEEMAGCTSTESTYLHLTNRCGARRVDMGLQTDITSRLDDIEAALFKVLLGAAELSKSGTVVRVAGGWVRDKLLGQKVTG